MNELDGSKIDRKAFEEVRIRAVRRVGAGEKTWLSISMSILARGLPF